MPREAYPFLQSANLSAKTTSYWRLKSTSISPVPLARVLLQGSLLSYNPLAGSAIALPEPYS
jgi:hypothetical protein